MSGSIIGETKLFTFTFLHVGAKAALTSAEKEEEGRSYNLLNSLILSGFMIEAYLNHLGSLRGFEKWNEKNDRTSVWNKYKILRVNVGLKELSIGDSYPEVAAAIEFRNELAHGRTETHKFSVATDEMLWPHQQQFPVGWQVSLTTANVRASFDACRKMIYELHKEAGLGNHPFSQMASSQMRFTAGK